MGVNRILATARRQLATGLRVLDDTRQRRPARSDEDETASPPSAEELAAAQRREAERNRFADDAAYFEFVIERAITAAAAQGDPT